MSRISENEREFKRVSYWRLIKYTKPYWKRLAIGIFFGLVIGGSLFSSFLIIPKLLMVVDAPDAGDLVKYEQTAERVVETIAANPDLTPEQKKKAVADALTPKAQKSNDPKLIETLESIQSFAEKCGLPLYVTLETQTVTLTWPEEYSFQITDPETGRIAWQFFSIYVFGFVFLWALKALATYINHYCTRWVGARVIMDMRNEVYLALLRQSMSFYGRQDVGHLISRCTTDTAAIESSVSDVIADITRCPLEILACAAALVYAGMHMDNFGVLICLVIGFPICTVPILVIARIVRRIYKKAFSNVAELLSRMHETFTGILIIKANNTEKMEFERFRKANKTYFRNQIRALRAQLLMSPLMELVAVSATLVFLVFAYRSGITITEMAMLLAPAVMAYKPIKDLARIVSHIQRSMAAADRYFDLIDQRSEMTEVENPVELKGFDKEIRFNHVRFAYEPGHWILNDMDLTIRKGQMVAVVGETGSGKSTIGNLIARFYDPAEGSVTIDGIPVKDLSIKSLRKHIGIVTQEPILFNETIADNIAYGAENVTREQIIEAAKQANAHDFIMSGTHPQNYDEEVGEKGCKLSGGEKQRIAIARAILKNPPILILDEATSALDTVTEKLVQDALNRVMTNRTVFAIAHRLSTIRNADKIIVLEKGKIVEAGTHDELLALNGKYKKLHDTQFALDGAANE
ncbi:MAG: ABC transporter ATP-binding protein [Lentisphaeria bacterium]|nr:ABC transporter ATP-binding protein [Lentisphaeria bacterium]